MSWSEDVCVGPPSAPMSARENSPRSRVMNKCDCIICTRRVLYPEVLRVREERPLPPQSDWAYLCECGMSESSLRTCPTTCARCGAVLSRYGSKADVIAPVSARVFVDHECRSCGCAWRDVRKHKTCVDCGSLSLDRT